MMRLLCIVALSLSCNAAMCVEPPANVTADPVIDIASFELTDIDGKVHRPFAAPEAKGAVLLFISTDCPVANYYQPTLRKLGEAYGPKGVAIFMVHANPALTSEQAREHARQFSIAAPVVLDPQHMLPAARERPRLRKPRW
jgi:thiol-disulfide isomerase/thioredoxin